MLKALIIDDEEMTRRGLIKNIPWDDLELKVIGEAEDGEDALELINKYKPEILLCDIRMPIMNGIELVKKVREKNYNCQIIFLSGYSDKEYLKTAIKIRAIDYVEKPIIISELVTALEKAIKIWKKERKQELNESRQNLEDKDHNQVSRTVYEVISYINENYNKDISIKSLAESVFLTPTYLCHLFKDETEKTINQYVTEVRIDKAKELLRNSNYMVYEIASKVGYSNSNYFARVFRKFTGESPSDYRG